MGCELRLVNARIVNTDTGPKRVPGNRSSLSPTVYLSRVHARDRSVGQKPGVWPETERFTKHMPRRYRWLTKVLARLWIVMARFSPAVFMPKPEDKSKQAGGDW